MNISGANSVRFVETPLTSQPAEFRVNQRISAEILRVSGDQVTMVVHGQQVVGRVMGGDQALLLANQRHALFLVKGMVDGVLQLQLIRPNVAASTVANQWTILAQNLLLVNGLPLNAATLNIGRALLSAGLPITPELLANMQNALAGIANWGQAEADVAASLLSNGLPLSAGTLSLALQQLPSLTESLERLQTQLAQLLKTSLPAETRALAERVMVSLQSASVNWSLSPAEIMTQLSRAVSVLGKSLESQLMQFLQESGELPDDADAASGMLAFALLRRELAKTGNTDLVRELDRFMDNLRQMQLLNSARNTDPTNPPWLMMHLLLNAGSLKDLTDMQNALLKIAYRADEEGNSIDADNNRIVLSINLEDGSVIQVDLSMVEKRVGAWMTVPDEEWQRLVEEELPDFEQRLEQLGYHMQFLRCEVKPPAAVLRANEPIRVNIEA